MAGFNGGADIVSSTNEFSNVVPGVTFTAKKESATAATVTIERDPSSLVTAARNFVNSYNSIVDAITDATGKDALNAADPSLNAIKQKLALMMTGKIGSYSEGFDSLGSIGIAANKDDRTHLSIDETKLNDALSSNRDRVAELFKRVDTTPSVTQVGVAARIASYIDEAHSVNGVF
ncbi:MAG: hypothetical protein EBT33_18185, partial [Betaproteobacteria bacterium]|nr:hypothetical protein [Betaproteobacteria bacterium]